MRARSLVRELKKIGPSLKEARVKLRKEWIPVWLKDPHAWREGTKMPTFRLDDTEVRAISAFIWQAGVEGKAPAQKSGDPEKGKDKDKGPDSRKVAAPPRYLDFSLATSEVARTEKPQ